MNLNKRKSTFAGILKDAYANQLKWKSLDDMADFLDIVHVTMRNYYNGLSFPNEKNLKKIEQGLRISINRNTGEIKTGQQNLVDITKDTNDVINNLLKSHEVIKDPIHGDIHITLLERALMDTKTFQQMRGITQLGPTQLVYPGAIHNRFIHSIGTLFVAKQIVDICNINFKAIEEATTPDEIICIEGYPLLLIRLSALLHDLGHIPYGHTLEDEGNLFPPEWEDVERIKKFNVNSELYNSAKKIIQRHNGKEELVKKIFSDLRKIFSSKKTDQILEYQYPYVIDIVSNTLCADLLDYYERDMYFCGLSERIGNRFMNYFAVLPLKKMDKKSPLASPDDYIYRVVDKNDSDAKGRLVLLGYRLEKDSKNPKNLKRLKKKILFLKQ